MLLTNDRIKTRAQVANNDNGGPMSRIESGPVDGHLSCSNDVIHSVFQCCVLK